MDTVGEMTALLALMAASVEVGGAALAEQWRDAVGEMMTWLAPMARDIVLWLLDKAFKKMRFEAALSSEFPQQIPVQIALSITSTPQI